MPVGWFIRLRLADDRVIAPEEKHRRATGRTILRTGRDHGLLSFRGVDEHLHLLSKFDRASAGQLARRVEIALTLQLPHDVGFMPARFDPIKDQDHLYSSLDYTLRQDKRHDYRQDPYHDVSALPELLEFRAGPTYLKANVEKYLPQVKTELLLKHLSPLRLDYPLETYAPLAAAAAASVALPDLGGKSTAAVLARAAAARIAIADLRQVEVADLLGVSPRAVHNLLRRGPPPARLLQALDRQLRLRQPGQRRPPAKL